MPIEFYSPVSGGAIATVIMQTGRELLLSGHQVSILTTIDDNPTYSVGTIVPIEYKTASDLKFPARFVSRVLGKLNGFDWPCFDYYLRSVLSALRGVQPAPDVVVLFNDLASSEYVRKVLPRTKIIVWQHNECSTRHDVRRTVAATDMFVSNSGYIRNWTITKHNIPEVRFVVAHNGVDLNSFRPRECYLDGSESLRVLCLGRIDPNKGPDIAVDAVAALRREGLRLSMTVAGGLWFYGKSDPMTDPYFRTLNAKMKSAEASYLGHVHRQTVPEVTRDHDVVCVLSRTNEPFALVALEAMASGCAVIASNRGGLPEACGGAAVLVDPDDFESVVAALRRFCSDRELLNRYKRESVARAARGSWAGCALIVEQAARGDSSAGVNGPRSRSSSNRNI